MNSNLEVSLFRAITGRGKSVKGSYVHEGVSDRELLERGFFYSNMSFAQYESSPGATGKDLRVPGLPIFLNFDEAEHFIGGKKYETAPAIVEARLPIHYLFGDERTVRLVRNYWDRTFGYEPTREDIEKHLSGERLIRGEAFIQGRDYSSLVDVLRPYQKIYCPNKMENGCVIIEEGFRVAEPPPNNISADN